ncbi:hypothetical protein [Conchiformibius steedae]|uniref:DUF2357 domain-containing protein n=1 Tax=Conchiformibius steedae TaxID=153493 RepID=A0A3P2A5P2_9NEIS|nr:hypothetical protein [Conchiformibius steedae]RRD90228.1 hypothetical protein EII21_06255 [Conchiformibius steedae]
MGFFDRFSGETISRQPENSEEGRFVDLASNEIVLSNQGKSYLANPKWNNQQLTEFDCITHAVKLIAQNYQKNASRSPLMPPELAQQAILLDLENELAEILAKGHLHAIALHPRLDVHYQDNVVALPRAKRLAKSALTHLSSHSDCWQRRTITGILPKKILAEFSEDFYEIYENRLYKCLLDRLENYLTKRLNWLSFIKQNLEDFLNFQNAESINFRLRNRICELWGENYQNNKIDTQLDNNQKSIQIIEKQLKTIIGLKQTGLYTKMPVYTHIPNQMRRTNILNHDEHYRHLPKLWDKLNLSQQDTLTLEQEKQWAIDLQNDYEDYIQLLLERVFEKYHFNSHNQSFLFAGNTYLIKKEHHCFVISDDTYQELLTIIPIVNQSNTYSIDFSANRIACSLFQQNNILNVSPKDLYVLEKMKDKIDEFLYQILCQNYAQRVHSIPNKIIELAKKYHQYFELSEKNSVKIIQPLSDDINHELNDLLNQYCNNETKIKFEKQIDNLDQIQNLCGCEQAIIDFRPNSNGFYAQCQNCQTIYKLIDNRFYKEIS